MQGDQLTECERIRVLVADNSRIHTQLLVDALKRDRHLHVISSASDSRGLIAAANLHQIDVTLMSSNLDEDPARGFKVLRELHVSHPEIRAIMLLDSSKRETILEAFRAGARGVVSRHESVEILCKCVLSVDAGQIWANSEQMSYAVEALALAPTVQAVDAHGFNLLSKRELEVVTSLAAGLTNREIGERLGLSRHTVKNYLFRVFDKLGVSSRIELLFMTMSQASAAQSAPQKESETSANGESAYDFTNLALCKNAAEQGRPDAQVALAEFYRDGLGIPKDPVTAYMWYLLGESTCLLLKEKVTVAKRALASAMTAEKILEAQRKAAERMKQPPKSSQQSSANGPLHKTQLLAGIICCAATGLWAVLVP